jgi:hypothetical protein
MIESNFREEYISCLCYFIIQEKCESIECKTLPSFVVIAIITLESYLQKYIISLTLYNLFLSIDIKFSILNINFHFLFVTTTIQILIKQILNIE